MIATGIAISSGHGVAITTKSAAKAAGPRPPVEVTSRAAPTGPRQTSRRSWPPGTTRARTHPKSRPGTESVGSRPFATSVPSTYNRLARRHAGNPALAYGTVIATGSGMARIRRVMYTTDSRPRHGARSALRSRWRKGTATLTIVHVIVPIVPLVPEEYLDTSTWARIDVQARRWADTRLARLAARARARGLRVTTLLFEGDRRATSSRRRERREPTSS